MRRSPAVRAPPRCGQVRWIASELLQPAHGLVGLAAAHARVEKLNQADKHSALSLPKQLRRKAVQLSAESVSSQRHSCCCPPVPLLPPPWPSPPPPPGYATPGP